MKKDLLKAIKKQTRGTRKATKIEESKKKYKRKKKHAEPLSES